MGHGLEMPQPQSHVPEALKRVHCASRSAKEKKKKAFQFFCVLISQKGVVVAGRQWLCVLNARGRGWKRRLLSAAPEDEPLCPATYLRYVQVNQVCAHRHIHSSVGYDIIIAN